MKMMTDLKKHEAFTTVEVLFALAILVIVMASVVGIQGQAKFMQRDSETESILFLEGARVLDQIERGDMGLQGIMKARAGSVAVVNAGRQVNFQVDANANYTTSIADDTGMSIFFDNGDGDDNTFDDNTIVFDNDTADAAATTLMTIADNIENVQFQVNGNMVTVNLTITTQVAGQNFRLNMSRNIYMRN